MTQSIRIGDRLVGEGQPAYVIAEISANHLQDLKLARELIRAAKSCGADAVKLQTYTADTLTIDSSAPPFLIHGTIWEGRTLHDLYTQASMPWEWHAELNDLAGQMGLDLFSTAYDPSSVELLERLGVPAFKIASFENVDIPLLRRVAATGKPVLISTGMAELSEIDEALRTLVAAGAREIAVLKCTSAYPAPPDQMNLKTIPDLAERFHVPVGLSDHTVGSAVAIAAVALGASVIEKHLALPEAGAGPDTAFSADPATFGAMVDGIRAAEAALGSVTYGPTADERPSLAFRRSLFVVRDMRSGELFSSENVRAIRPSHGLHPRHLDDVIGRAATRDIARGTPLSWDLIGRTSG